MDALMAKLDEQQQRNSLGVLTNRIDVLAALVGTATRGKNPALENAEQFEDTLAELEDVEAELPLSMREMTMPHAIVDSQKEPDWKQYSPPKEKPRASEVARFELAQKKKPSKDGSQGMPEAEQKRGARAVRGNNNGGKPTVLL